MSTIAEALRSVLVTRDTAFKVGDRIYDPFLIRYGTVQKVLRDGRLEIYFDYIREGNRRVMHSSEVRLIHPACFPVDRRKPTN